MRQTVGTRTLPLMFPLSNAKSSPEGSIQAIPMRTVPRRPPRCCASPQSRRADNTTSLSSKGIDERVRLHMSIDGVGGRAAGPVGCVRGWGVLYMLTIQSHTPDDAAYPTYRRRRFDGRWRG